MHLLPKYVVSSVLKAASALRAAPNLRSCVLLSQSTAGYSPLKPNWLPDGKYKSFASGGSPANEATPLERGMLGGELSKLLQNLHAASTEDIVTAAKLCSRQGLRCHSTLQPLAEAAVSRLRTDGMDGRQLSELAVAFSTVGYFDIAYKRELARAVVDNMHLFSTRAFSDIAWAFGQSQFTDYVLMAAMASFVKEKVSHFTSSELARVLWMFARLRYLDAGVMELGPVAVDKLLKQGGFCPTSLSEVVHATAAMGSLIDARLQHLVLNQVPSNIQLFNHDALVKLLCSLERIGLARETLLVDAITSRVEALLRMEAANQHETSDQGQHKAAASGDHSLDLVQHDTDAEYGTGHYETIPQGHHETMTQGQHEGVPVQAMTGLYDSDGLMRPQIMGSSHPQPVISPAHTTKIAWALSESGVCIPPLMEKLAFHVTSHLNEYSLEQLETLINSFNRLNISGSAVAPIAAHVLLMVPDIKDNAHYDHARAEASRVGGMGILGT